MIKARDKFLIAVAIGSCKDTGIGLCFAILLEEDIGDEVIDAILLDQPLFAIIECGEGDIAQLSVRGIEDRIGFGLFEVFFDGFDEYIVEFLTGISSIKIGFC